MVRNSPFSLKNYRFFKKRAVREGRGVLDVRPRPGLSRAAPLVRQQLGRLREAESGVEAAEEQQQLFVPHPGRVRQRQSQARHQELRRQNQIRLRGIVLQCFPRIFADSFGEQVRPPARGRLAGVVDECSAVHKLDKSNVKINHFWTKKFSILVAKLVIFVFDIIKKMCLI
jgi:hypothetical protein